MMHASHRSPAALALALSLASAPALAADFRARLPQDEVIYFVLPDRFANGDTANDRGGLAGDRLHTGFDPASKAFYNGGDLRGLIQHLDYIQGLGATTIWLGPIFRNKPVQGEGARASAGYHGYWITDFTHVDPHFGSDADFKALVDAAHGRGLKLYMDIVANHTADVIKYRECPANDCAYRSRADFPYSRRGGVAGTPINTGFIGDDVATTANFARLTRPDFAYTPYIPAGEVHAKVPEWLNDPIYYHNRGDSLFRGESSTFGDFSGLDDLDTEDPRVIAGFIEIYGGWIDRFGIDGFRIDTAQHVDAAFWRAFVPAIQSRAKARGIANFAIFGEVAADEMDPARLARHTREDKLPGVLDFAFSAAAIATIAGGEKGPVPTSLLARLYADDPLYEGGWQGAMANPTFLGNHDKGRFAWYVRRANPRASDAEIASRVLLGHALMMFGRGAPTLYAGDEQGFAGSGGDQDSRQSLFASRVASYNTETLVATTATTATDNFNTGHPFYTALAAMAAIRAADPALRRGATLVRASGDTSGVFAFSRVIEGRAGETLVAINTATTVQDAQVPVAGGSLAWRSLGGACAARASAPGSYRIHLAPLSWAVCTSTPAGTPQ